MQVHSLSSPDLSSLANLVRDRLETGFRPTLAIVFSAPVHDIGDLSHLLKGFGLQVFGATTAGEIYDNEVTEDAISLMLLEMPEDCFRIEMAASGEEGYEATTRRLAATARNAYRNPGVIVLFSGLKTNGDLIVNRFREELGEGVPLAGGMAGDNARMEKIEVFCTEGRTDDGICLLVLDNDRIELNTRAASGWLPVGIEKTITRSEGNLVYTINDIPAMSVYRKYFGLTESDDAKDVIDIAIQYPLQMKRPNGLPVLRAPLVGNAEDGSIVFAGSVPEGSEVKLSISPGSQITEEVLKSYADLPGAIGKVDAIILFSCICRKQALGPWIEDEIQGIHSLWDVPMTGFFTYGEIGSQKGDSCYFHNETCVLTTLKERT